MLREWVFFAAVCVIPVLAFLGSWALFGLPICAIIAAWAVGGETTS